MASTKKKKGQEKKIKTQGGRGINKCKKKKIEFCINYSFFFLVHSMYVEKRCCGWCAMFVCKDVLYFVLFFVRCSLSVCNVFICIHLLFRGFVLKGNFLDRGWCVVQVSYRYSIGVCRLQMNQNIFLSNGRIGGRTIDMDMIESWVYDSGSR